MHEQKVQAGSAKGIQKESYIRCAWVRQEEAYIYEKEGYESMRHTSFLAKNMDLKLPQHSLSVVWICFEVPASSPLDLLQECVRESAIES